jgi:hypothetical protein
VSLKEYLMNKENKILELFNSYKFSYNFRLKEIKYEPNLFGNFFLEIFINNTLFRVVNDRGQLFVDKYIEKDKEWENTDFIYNKVDFDNIEESLYNAFKFIENRLL